MSEQDCLFCKIVAGEIPADIVFESDSAIAFRDINPAAPVHVLIVPIKPIPTVNDMAPEDVPLLGRMVAVARDIAAAEGLSDDGYRLIMNCNRHGGQEVERGRGDTLT